MRAASNPRIRNDLDFIPIQHQGEQLVLVRDHLGLVDEGKALPARLLDTLGLLDGSRDIRDIQISLMQREGGVLVKEETVERLLEQLDAAFILDSPGFRAARDKIREGFKAQSVRPCFHCGRSYPNDKTALENRLNQMLAGLPPERAEEGKAVAVVAPHIDFNVGSEVYAKAYQKLRRSRPARVVILGVGHQMSGDLFCLTEKDFQTPFGTVKTDQAAVRRLRAAGKGIIAEDDFAHRNEHSVEFQLVWLQHVLRSETFTLVPVLCGPLKDGLGEYNRETYLATAGSLLEVLAAMPAATDRETLLVAGVDFSHVGPKFGHSETAAGLETAATRHDKALLKALTEGNADLFWQESMDVDDRFNVCGFAALTCLLEVMPACRGRLLEYRLWHEQATSSAVSFAALAFERQAE